MNFENTLKLDTGISFSGVKEKAEPKRIDWIDYAKGIGIILVVFGHVVRGLDTAGFTSPYFDISDKFIYAFHMPLFFLLSGIFAEKWAKKSFKSAITNKLMTILYPYFLWSLIQGGFNILLSSVTSRSMGVADLARIIYEPIGQFWFLYSLFIIFLVYFGFRRIFDLQGVFFISIILFLVSPFVNFWLLPKLFSMFVYFVLGAVLALKFNIIQNINYLVKPVGLIFVIATFCILNLLFVVDYSSFSYFANVIITFLLALVGILFCLQIAVILDKCNSFTFIKLLGQLSLVIFVAHILGTEDQELSFQSYFILRV